MSIDAKSAPIGGLDLNAGGQESINVPNDVDPSHAAEAGSSGLENELWEELILVPSISTVKALQIAAQDNIPQLIIDSNNASAVLPTVTGPKAFLKTLAQYVADGATITISQQPITYGDWTGFGYILDAPSSFGYFISQTNTSLNGGSSAFVPGPLSGPPGSTGNANNTGGTLCGDPVNVTNGNLYQNQVDLNISSRGPSILFSRTYNSLSAASGGPLGFGWTHNYAMSIKNVQTSAIFTDQSGGVYMFPINDGEFASPPGLDLSLTQTAQGYTLRSKHGTQWKFNTNGVLESITDRNQNTVTLGYTNGNLTTITDALNRVVTLSYDGQNRITEIQDFAARKLTYAYDSSGNLASFTDPANNRTAYAYYTNNVFPHLLQTVTKPAGNSTSFEYYANKEMARVSDSAGRNMRFFYLPMHNETMFIDPRGFTGSYYYNAAGNVTRAIKADGTYQQYTFSEDLKMTSYTDEDGNSTAYTYDSLGNATSVTDQLGNTTKLTYEPNFNHVASITNPGGAVTTFEYDAHGNLAETSRPLGVQTHFTYDTYGQLLTATDGDGNTTSVTRDASGNPVKFTDALGNVTEAQFDSLRRLIAIVDALGGTARRQLDAVNRVTSATNQLAATISLAYDGNSNFTQATGPNGRKVSYTYDALDNLTQVTDALGKTSMFSYATPDCGCSSNSDLISYRDAAGQTLTYAYDFNERTTQVVDAAGNASSFGYSARGDLLTKTDANGNAIQYQYDAAGHLLRKTFPDGTDVQFAYDANGNLMSAANANTTLTLKYDQLNRVASITDSRFGQTIQYAYDHNGKRTTMTDSTGGATSYTYDANGNLTSLTTPSRATVHFAYDALNRRKTLQYSNGVTTSYEFDKASQLVELATSGGGPRITYTYDSNGNPTAISDALGSNSFAFDELNRVTGVTHAKAASENYSYDGAGNRLSSASGKYAYDTAGRLLSAAGVTYAYDNNGNLIKRTESNGSTSFSYDFENRLTGITFPDGSKAAYAYDALGRRIRKTVKAVVTNYLYDGVHILLETDHTGALLARYTQGPGVDRTLIMERDGKNYFYQTDRMGSVIELTDSSGKLVCSYSYDSFGNTQPCAALTNPFAYAGREYDSESGLYYMRARYYDSATGRFITSDPLDLTGRLLAGQDQRARITMLPIASSALAPQAGPAGRYSPQQLNRYSYAANNPAVFRDPSGLGCSNGLNGLLTAGIGPILWFKRFVDTYGNGTPEPGELPESVGQIGEDATQVNEINAVDAGNLSQDALELSAGDLEVTGTIVITDAEGLTLTQLVILAGLPVGL